MQLWMESVITGKSFNTRKKKSSPLNKHKTKNVETQHKSTQQNLPDPLKLTKT